MPLLPTRWQLMPVFTAERCHRCLCFVLVYEVCSQVVHPDQSCARLWCEKKVTSKGFVSVRLDVLLWIPHPHRLSNNTYLKEEQMWLNLDSDKYNPLVLSPAERNVEVIMTEGSCCTSQTNKVKPLQTWKFPFPFILLVLQNILTVDW